MKVLYDHEIFARQPFGGISRYFSEIIPRLAAMDDTEVSLFMGFHVNRYGLPRYRRRYTRFFGLQRWPERSTYRLTKTANRVMFQLFARRPVDIVHETAYANPRVPSGKRIVTLHDLIPERFPALFGAQEDMFGHKRQSVIEADGVICVSEQTRLDMLEFYGQPRGKVAVIHHANSLRIPAEQNSPFQFPYLLFVGSRSGYKDFQTLLTAYASSKSLINSVHLICCGGGAFAASELEQIARAGLESKVQQLSASDAQLATLYAHAVAFIYPSLYEGFGIPLLEAMHYGCPVVASRASCFSEIAGAAALFFDAGDAEDLSVKLNAITTDKPLAQKLKNAGKAREDQFNWDIAAARTAHFYRDVAAGI